MLRVLALLFFLCPLSATAAAPTPFIRLGVNIKASHKLMAHAEKTLMAALDDAHEFPDTVPPSDYRRASARLHGQHPYGGTVSVKRVGQELHVTHVVVVALESRPGDRKRQLFADTSVFDVPNAQLIFRQRYFLPQGMLTDSTARFIVARLQALLTGPKSPKPQMAESSISPEMSGHEIDTEHPERKEQHPEPVVPPGEPLPEAAAVAEGRVFADRSHFGVGGALSARKALLTSNGTPLPVCYCNKGGFGSLMAGAALNGGLYFNPNVTNFGLDVDVLVEFAQTQVLNNGVTATISSIFWQAMGAAAYRLNLPANVELHVRLGYAFRSFPLAEGVFPTLNYGAPVAGLALVIPLWEDILTLFAHADYLALVQVGGWAAVFGQASQGQGVQADGGIRGRVGPLELTARVAWDIIVVSFTGTTMLNLPTNYANVTLSDQHVEGSLTLAGRF